MVEKMAAALINGMVDEALIDKNKKEEYIYAFITLMEQALTVLTIFIISISVNLIIPTFMFLLLFFSLRKRTGGYHADNFLKCYIGTVMIYVLIITVIYPLLMENPIVMYVLLVISAIFIEIIGTVNHPNMDLNLGELAEAQKAARLVNILEVFCIVVAAGIGADRICITLMSLAVILCAVLLGISKIIKQEVKEDAKEN